MSAAGPSRQPALMLVGWLLCVAVSLLGQVSSGEIRGKIRDPSGAAVPAARITVTFVSKNTIRQAISSEPESSLYPAWSRVPI